MLICYNVLIRQTITIQWVHPKIVSLEHFSLNWQKLVSQVSISSTFYAHIFCTKACFWHQNFVRMLYFEFKIFGAEFRMKITHKKHWWNWHQVEIPKILSFFHYRTWKVEAICFYLRQVGTGSKTNAPHITQYYCQARPSSMNSYRKTNCYVFSNNLFIERPDMGW